MPSHSRTLSICVSPLQSGLLIKILQVSVFAGPREPAHRCCNLRPPGAAHRQWSRVTCRQSPQQPPPCPHQERAYFWVASVHPIEAMGWGGGSLIRDLNLEYIYF